MKNFYEKILNWKNAKPSTNVVTQNGNELICNVRDNVKNDYLHVLFYPLKEKKVKKDIDFLIRVKKSNVLDEYSKFLSCHNGMILYCGAIVFFGITENNLVNEFVEPPSLKKLNQYDYYFNNNSYLYIGNMMYFDYNNINIYINPIEDKILLIENNKLINQFETLSTFLNHLIEFYNSKYDFKGLNINYNDRKKHVYENTQLYY